jgi:iron(III) transport system substrate-binding protein
MTRFGALVAALMVASGTASAAEVNVYSSRHYDSDKVLVERFTRATGIKVKVIEADIGPLVQRLQAEGRNSPADVLVTVDIANLWRAKELGLLQPVRSATIDEFVAPGLRDPDGHWTGLSQRARVLVHAKDRVKPGELSTYEALADPKWKGRIVVRTSTHVYNQSLTAAMIAANGVEKTEAWARALAGNLARPPQGGDADQIKAVAAGLGDVAIVNTYYLARMLAPNASAEDKAVAEKVAVFFPNQDGRGAHINISGAGVTRNAPNRDNAIKYIEFMLGAEAQRIFAEGNHEYPVRPGIAQAATVMSLGPFKADHVALAELGRFNAEAVRLADRAGWR